MPVSLTEAGARASHGELRVNARQIPSAEVGRLTRTRNPRVDNSDQVSNYCDELQVEIDITSAAALRLQAAAAGAARVRRRHARARPAGNRAAAAAYTTQPGS